MITYFIFNQERNAYLKAEIRTPSGARVAYWTNNPAEAKTYKTWEGAKNAARRLGAIVRNAKEVLKHVCQDQ